MSENKNSHPSMTGAAPRDREGKPEHWRTRDSADPSAKVGKETCEKVTGTFFPNASFTITQKDGTSISSNLKSMKGKALLVFVMPGLSESPRQQKFSKNTLQAWNKIPYAAECPKILKEISDSETLEELKDKVQVVILTTQQPKDASVLAKLGSDAIWYASDPTADLTAQLPTEFSFFQFNGTAFHRRFTMFVKDGKINATFESNMSVDEILQKLKLA